MPLLLIALAAAGLGVGIGAKLFGQGAQQTADATTQVLIAGGAVYLVYMTFKPR